MIKLQSSKIGLGDYLRKHPHREGIIVSEIHKFIYMKPTKTAGTSILRHFLEKQISDIVHYKDHPQKFDNWINKISDAELEEYFIFSVVRNPFDRFVSSSAYLKIPLEELLFNFEENTKVDKVYTHTLPLHYYTHNNGILFVDYICRMENLQPDMNLVFDAIGIERQDLPVTNVSKRDSCQKYFDDKSKAKLLEIYEKDILYYGYSFEKIDVSTVKKKKRNYFTFLIEKINRKIGNFKKFTII